MPYCSLSFLVKVPIQIKRPDEETSDELNEEFNNESQEIGPLFLDYYMDMTPDEYTSHCQHLVDQGELQENSKGDFIYQFSFSNSNIESIDAVLMATFDYSSKDTSKIVLNELEFLIRDGFENNTPKQIFDQLSNKFEVLHDGVDGMKFSRGISWLYKDVSLSVEYMEYPVSEVSVRYFNEYDLIYSDY